MVEQGCRWLDGQQNADGGWGDTDRSHSNIATTMLVRAAFHLAAATDGRQPSLERAELPVVAHAWRALAAEDWSLVGEICALASALKTTREVRIASRNVGRQRVELLARLRPGTLASSYPPRELQRLR